MADLKIGSIKKITDRWGNSYVEILWSSSFWQTIDGREISTGSVISVKSVRLSEDLRKKLDVLATQLKKRQKIKEDIAKLDAERRKIESVVYDTFSDMKGELNEIVNGISSYLELFAKQLETNLTNRLRGNYGNYFDTYAWVEVKSKDTIDVVLNVCSAKYDKLYNFPFVKEAYDGGYYVSDDANSQKILQQYIVYNFGSELYTSNELVTKVSREANAYIGDKDSLILYKFFLKDN